MNRVDLADASIQIAGRYQPAGVASLPRGQQR
jgi:hypothetical protein